MAHPSPAQVELTRALLFTFLRRAFLTGQQGGGGPSRLQHVPKHFVKVAPGRSSFAECLLTLCTR